MNNIYNLAQKYDILDKYSEEKIIKPTIKIFGFIIEESTIQHLEYMISHKSGHGSCMHTDNERELITFMDSWFKEFTNGK